MTKIARHIAIYFFTLLFLLTATGITVTMHYCKTDKIAGYFFYANPDNIPCSHKCCEDHSGSNNIIGECCDAVLADSDLCTSDDACCSNQTFYIAVEDDFVKTSQPEITSFTKLLNWFPAFIVLIPIESGSENRIAHYNQPPDLNFGIDFQSLISVFIL